MILWHFDSIYSHRDPHTGPAGSGLCWRLRITHRIFGHNLVWALTIFLRMALPHGQVHLMNWQLGVWSMHPRDRLWLLAQFLAFVSPTIEQNFLPYLLQCDGKLIAMLTFTFAKYVASGVQFLLLHGVAADAWVHQDLWTALADELQCLQERQLVPHWIPSHLDEGALESPYEDWVRVHNDQADRQAGVANLNRPHALLSLQSEAIEHHRSTADRLRQLKFFISKFCHSR